MAGSETKVCDACDVECGVNEEKCPKCGVEFKELDELVSTVERANTIAEKRRKRNSPPEPPPQPKTTISQRLRGLGKIIK